MSSLFERDRATGKETLLDDIIKVYAPRSVSERLDRILMNLAVLSRKPGEIVNLSNDEVSALWADSDRQMEYFLEALEARDWVDHLHKEAKVFRLSPDGWNRLAELEEASPASENVFVAMAFDPSLDAAWDDGIKPALSQDTGYVPLRVDKKEHNEKICDLIVASIRKSRFLVADVTLQRAGTYFEAGYAMGRGLEVIWSCRVDEKDKCHFDTRQYNHIFWENPEQLRLHLARRIEGTIGLGPRKK